MGLIGPAVAVPELWVARFVTRFPKREGGGAQLRSTGIGSGQGVPGPPPNAGPVGRADPRPARVQACTREPIVLVIGEPFSEDDWWLPRVLPGWL
jgi:hypothetical protein